MPLPQRGSGLRNGASGFGVGPCGRFNFDIGHQTMLTAACRDLIQSGQLFALKGRAEPTARIKLRQLVPRELARNAPAVAGAI